MGKITVKHFLNTNLKPYIINGEKYFSIYVLVTANRQNTKVKSKAFNEYYNERDFSEIINPENTEDSEIIKNEESTITNIANLLITEFETFDTTLFSAVYNYYQTIYVFDLELDNNTFERREKTGKNIINLYKKDKNKMGLGIDVFFIEPFSLKENNAKGMSIYTWFSPKGQKELSDFLVKNNCKYDTNRTVEILNKIVFYSSFDKLSWMMKGTRKFESLANKYYDFFEMANPKMYPYLLELSITE